MTKVNGELISIDDSAYDGFKGMTIYGKTVQNLWVNPNGTRNGVTVTSNDDGSIDISGEAASDTFIASQKIYALKQGVSYFLSVDKIIGTTDDYSTAYVNIGFFSESESIGNAGGVSYGSAYSRVFKFPENAVNCNTQIAVKPAAGQIDVQGLRVMLREATPEEIAKAAGTPQTLPVYPDGSGPDASDGELGIMPLEEAPTLADSDFYGYWCPPGLNSVGDSGDISVVTGGKNLFNAKEGIGDVSGWSATQLSDAGDGWIKATVSSGALGINYASDKFRFLANTTYTLSFEAYAYKSVIVSYNYIIVGGISGNVSLASLGATGPFVTTTKQRVHTTFRTKEEIVGNIMVGISSGLGIDNELYVRNIQLERGATSTGYELPAYTVTPVPLYGHSLRSLPDGTRDELHIDREGNCTLVKRVGSYVADTSDSANNGNGVVAFELDELGKTTSSYIMSEALPVVGGSAWNDGKSWCAIGNNGHLYGHIANETDYAKAMDACIGKRFIYPLREPQTIQLGKISLPKLRKKPLVNNIWANGTAEGTNFSLAPEIDYEYNQWSTYCDGFKTHGKHSYFDMGCCIAARDTGTPEKKSVTATVPYMSGFYDLSKLYGAIAFEARQLMYRFEFVEDSRDELQQRKSQFLEWLSQVHDEEIADDDIPGRHFIGSLSEWEFEEGEEGQSGSLEVTFNCQPFLEADEDTTKTCNAGSNTVTVAGQAVNAYAKTNSGTATIRIGGVTQSVGTTEIRLSVQLQPGDNAVTVTGSPVVLRWRELTV